MIKENINIEYVSEDNSRFLKNILRDDISEDFVDSLDVCYGNNEIWKRT